MDSCSDSHLCCVFKGHHHFERGIMVSLIKKGTSDPVLGGKGVMRKSGEIFSRQMDYQCKCPKWRHGCLVLGTARRPLPPPRPLHDLKEWATGRATNEIRSSLLNHIVAPVANVRTLRFYSWFDGNILQDFEREVIWFQVPWKNHSGYFVKNSLKEHKGRAQRQPGSHCSNVDSSNDESLDQSYAQWDISEIARCSWILLIF